MSTDQDLDFSTRNVPDSWHAAAAQGPQGRGGRLARKSPLRAVPSGGSADLFSAFMAGTVTSGLLGFVWYYLETAGIMVAPWMALVLGVVLALVIRGTAGPDDPGTRATVAVLFHLTTSTTVIVLISRDIFAAAYGSDPGLAEFEQSLIHSRLGQAPSVLFWAAGAVAAATISHRLRRRP